MYSPTRSICSKQKCQAKRCPGKYKIVVFQVTGKRQLAGHNLWMVIACFYGSMMKTIGSTAGGGLAFAIVAVLLNTTWISQSFVWALQLIKVSRLLGRTQHFHRLGHTFTCEERDCTAWTAGEQFCNYKIYLRDHHSTGNNKQMSAVLPDGIAHAQQCCLFTRNHTNTRWLLYGRS